MARLKRLGMVAIPPAAGLAALAHIISDHAQRSQASRTLVLSHLQPLAHVARVKLTLVVAAAKLIT
jgi:hypothetical protein